MDRFACCHQIGSAETISFSKTQGVEQLTRSKTRVAVVNDKTFKAFSNLSIVDPNVAIKSMTFTADDKLKE